jgi:hypothetical protein
VRAFATRLLVLLLLGGAPALAAAPASESPHRGRVVCFVQRRVEAVRQQGLQLKASWKDPAGRAKLYRKAGEVGFAGMLIAAGEAVDWGLRNHMPPLEAAFLSASVPTYAGYYLQHGLSKIAGRFIDSPSKTTQAKLLGDAAFAGTVGVVGKLALDKLGAIADRHLFSDDIAAFGRVGAQALVRTAHRLLQRIRPAVRKVADQGVGSGADKLRDRYRDTIDDLRERLGMRRVGKSD